MKFVRYFNITIFSRAAGKFILEEYCLAIHLCGCWIMVPSLCFMWSRSIINLLLSLSLLFCYLCLEVSYSYWYWVSPRYRKRFPAVGWLFCLTYLHDSSLSCGVDLEEQTMGPPEGHPLPCRIHS